MTIDRDDRQTRLEWMIDEFQQARRRWLVKRDVTTVESQMDADTNGPIAPSAARRPLSGERVATP
jgi:hypothetical protein